MAFQGRCLRALALCCAIAQALRPDLPDVSVEGIPAVKAWARERITEGERAFASSGLRRHTSPPSWEGVVVYQIQTDRFNNGDVSNDMLNVLPEQVEAMESGNLSSLPSWRHGGDLQGIRDRLGYLADLGVQVLWVTPILKHTGAYHGYCTTDPTTVDPGFGTPDELRDLVAEAHKHGMLVVLDVVINHLCDLNSNYSRAPDHVACTDSLAAHFWEGDSTPVGQGGLDFSPNFFPPFRSEQFFNRCGANSVEEMQGSGTPAVFGDFVEGMFDYRTDDRDFQEIFADLHKYWVAYADLDGMRLDAAKHVTQDFLAYFSTELREYAKTVGKENFFVIGEVAALPPWQASTLGTMDFLEPQWGFTGEPAAVSEVKESLEGQYENLAEGQRFPGLPAVYNFNMSGISRSALSCFNGSSIIKDFFGSEAYRDITQESVPLEKLWTLLEIHDWTRFLTEIPERADLLITGVAWLLTAPGSPVLYYGVEQGFNGHCPAALNVSGENATGALKEVCDSVVCGYKNDTHVEDCGSSDELKRQDMFASGPWRLGSAVAEVDAMSYVGESAPGLSPPWQSDPMLPRGHRVYSSIRGMAHLRRSCSALASGRIEWQAAGDAPCGVLAFSRWLEGVDGSDVFVVINPGGQGDVTLPVLRTSRAAPSNTELRYLNVFDPSDAARIVATAGTLDLALENPTVVEGGVSIFVREDRLRAFDETLGVALCDGLEGSMHPARQPLAGDDCGGAFTASCGQNRPMMWLAWAGIAVAVVFALSLLTLAIRWRWLSLARGTPLAKPQLDPSLAPAADGEREAA